MSNDPFRQAEDQFFLLKGQLASGRITREQFEAALTDLPVQDSQGRYWMLGADSGKWYVHAGNQWVEADPYSGSAAMPAPPGLAPAEPRKTWRLPVLLLGILLIVVLLVAAIVVMLGPHNTLLRIELALGIPGRLTATGGLPSATPSPLAVIQVAATTTPTLAFTPTAVLSATSEPSAAVPSATAEPPTATTSQTATLSPSPAASPTAAPSATLLPPTSTRLPAPTAAPSATPLPSNTPTPSFPPGVYVTHLRSDPAQPLNLQQITFYATFMNTTGGGAVYRWCIEVWDPNNSKNAFGNTSCRDSGTIPVGVNEITALDTTYRIVRGGSCLPLRARVIWMTNDNARVPFTQPDGSIYWYGFQVCPA